MSVPSHKYPSGVLGQSQHGKLLIGAGAGACANIPALANMYEHMCNNNINVFLFITKFMVQLLNLF